MQAFNEISRCRTLSLEDSLNLNVTENYPLHLGTATPGDGRVVGGITETEIQANISPPSSLPAAPRISGDMHGTSCNIRHLNLYQAMGQLAPPSSQESCFLSVMHDAGFLPTSADFSTPSMPLDPFYADWPHWDSAATHTPHPPRPARPAPSP